MKRNIKGFTLIELLAVIIILGVLMLIAIPSVTEYISSSRKSAFVDTASSYISTVRNRVNAGESLKFYDTATIYFVQVGHDKTKSCVSLEKGGASPFNDTWRHNYVAVTYDGNGYTYYYTAQDASGQGIALVLENTMAKDGKDLVKTGTADFSTTYGLTAPATTYANRTGAPAALVTAINEAGVPETKVNIVIVNRPNATTECTY